MGTSFSIRLDQRFDNSEEDSCSDPAHGELRRISDYFKTSMLSRFARGQIALTHVGINLVMTALFAGQLVSLPANTLAPLRRIDMDLNRSLLAENIDKNMADSPVTIINMPVAAAWSTTALF
jgi:hypothetical protein